MKKMAIQTIDQNLVPNLYEVELSTVPNTGDILEEVTGKQYIVKRRLFNLYTGEIIIQAADIELK